MNSLTLALQHLRENTNQCCLLDKTENWTKLIFNPTVKIKVCWTQTVLTLNQAGTQYFNKEIRTRKRINIQPLLYCELTNWTNYRTELKSKLKWSGGEKKWSDVIYMNCNHRVFMQQLLAESEMQKHSRREAEKVPYTLNWSNR